MTADKAEDHTVIVMNEPVALTFALRYMNNFSKATALGPSVKLGLTKVRCCWRLTRVPVHVCECACVCVLRWGERQGWVMMSANESVCW